jgi:hypothetical protein
MNSDAIIEIKDSTDAKLLEMAKGAHFSNTKLPSGFVVPVAPEGKGYYGFKTDSGWVLVLRDSDLDRRRGRQ